MSGNRHFQGGKGGENLCFVAGGRRLLSLTRDGLLDLLLPLVNLLLLALERLANLVSPRGRRRFSQVILWNPSPDPRAPNFAFLEGTLAFLSALAAAYELYLVTVVGSEEEAQHVQWGLEQSGLYDSPPPALDRRRVLFCKTEQGKSHIVRHVEPLVHVDANRQVAEGLARFVKHVVLVQKAGGGGGTAGAHGAGKPTPANVETCTSILTSSLNRIASQNK
ncbi:MAG: hypothetical protein BJ554DRAFT_2572 [Olpidium bornovanus]|uniref:Uncharacterized protein n=1 Tax=Olpidium bornovanus TaxID=278681 RepID=A0A8H7ZQ94_9FUNG|nr:MAG: hypothetical protein BJ554DRAFT_2572 [Olpidium bornovanus]